MFEYNILLLPMPKFHKTIVFTENFVINTKIPEFWEICHKVVEALLIANINTETFILITYCLLPVHNSNVCTPSILLQYFTVLSDQRHVNSLEAGK